MGMSNTKKQVTAFGQKMRRSMRKPSDWKIHVHENLGWFVRLIHVRYEGLNVSPGYNLEPRYDASLSDNGSSGCNAEWFDHKTHNTPQEAVDHRIRKARQDIKRRIEVFAKITAKL